MARRPGFSGRRAWAAEALGTALLVLAIIWLGSPWTGASINPARSEGPALAFGDLSDLWLYVVAPSVAALAVGLAWRVTPTPLPALPRDT